MRRFLDLFLSLFKLSLIGSLLFLGSCATARTILKQAPTDLPRGWTVSERTLLPEAMARSLLQSELYGRLKLDPQVEVESLDVLDEAALDGRATLVQWRLQIGYGQEVHPLDLVALLPNAKPSAPLILTQNFCPNNNVIPLPGVRAPNDDGFDCSGGGIFGLIMGNVFGRYIVTPPLEDILDRGYAIAAVYPSQFVPDSAETGLTTLERLFSGNDTLRPGALSVWASLIPVAAQTIENAFGERPIISYGHSRFGKTALLAGAWSDDIDAVLAHQSGTLGASSMDDRDGEPLSALVDGYPHWPGKGARRYAEQPASLPVRPADLLALLNDKPVLLGNARRDVWSDPWGAFKEAKQAWGTGFSASAPSDFRPANMKAYWLRPGTHGVVKEDWPAFLDFLDANVMANEKWRPREDLNPQPAD